MNGSILILRLVGAGLDEGAGQQVVAAVAGSVLFGVDYWCPGAVSLWSILLEGVRLSGSARSTVGDPRPGIDAKTPAVRIAPGCAPPGPVN